MAETQLPTSDSPKPTSARNRSISVKFDFTEEEYDLLDDLRLLSGAPSVKGIVRISCYICIAELLEAAKAGIEFHESQTDFALNRV